MAETYEFRLDFLRSLVGRGLRGVQLVISDAPEGLKRAISEGTGGRQLAAMPRAPHAKRAGPDEHPQAMVAALVRTIFAQPDLESAREQLEHVATVTAGRKMSA